MSRVQLALNVTNIDQAVEFYSKLFDAQPAKRQPGYANFAIADPPLKLVLIENPGAAARLNHLGVELEDQSAVAEAKERLTSESLLSATEEGVNCCYALQDKVWATDPDQAPWEFYTVLANTDSMGSGDVPAEARSCCV
ncbi:MAG TPA: ArsI/CadI family heavy metal resistance metalloenzyme [Chloroflexota bacterium]|nr:ArsI/CadI family heavy metal resistance metalloenzyme [Chloroflexota bacterium]